MYWNEKLGKTQPRVARFELSITGAKTNSSVIPGIPLYTAYDAIAAQSTIDGFLGTTNEFLIAQFDATALGANTLGFFVNLMGGASAQGSKVLSARLDFWDAAGAVLVPDFAPAVTTLSSSTLVNEVAVGASGNIAGRITAAGLDAATSGKLILEVHWISK